MGFSPHYLPDVAARSGEVKEANVRRDGTDMRTVEKISDELPARKVRVRSGEHPDPDGLFPLASRKRARAWDDNESAGLYSLPPN
ncbi:MAG: hypothetical protein WBM24_03280 [Candidatus Sulfotelmatobacter sp.]